MFNYWTEGGFIGWGQEPDGDTGRTPLQLFMDGRAQAAYEPKDYNTWSTIMAGGSVVGAAKIRKITPDYAKVGEWIDKQLKKRDVWVVLMPANQFNSPFVKGVEANLNWALVFLNDKQRLFVDITTPQGKEVFEGVFNGKTLYPDDFSKNLIIAHNMLLFGKEQSMKKQGLDSAIKAFELNPSQTPMQKIIFAARFPELRPLVIRFCKNYLDDFMRNKNLYAKQDGYLHRVWSALVAIDYLRKVAQAQKNPNFVRFCDAKRKQYLNEQKPLRERMRW